MIDTTDTQTPGLTLSATPAVADPKGLTLVSMDDIETLPQVRTESGWDDESLNALAESIKTTGLLQLPLLRWDAMRKKYIVIAGHRRIEAMRRAGFPEFYAITGSADQQQAHLMQLTENIHREQLTTKETAYALRTLSDQGHDLGAIAVMVNKSKPWVSKHLSVTHPEFGKYARHLFETCAEEDLEILNSLSQAEKAVDKAIEQDTSGHEWKPGCEWVQARAPSTGWTRKEAAKAAKDAKKYTVPAVNPKDEKREPEDNDTADKAKPATSSEDEKAAARMLQDAMVSLIGRINAGNETDARGALSYLIGYACGGESARLEGTRQALIDMLK
jgi:ParB/RepB/Spo0J family partition protein